MTIEKRQLGQTQLELPALGCGCASIGNLLAHDVVTSVILGLGSVARIAQRIKLYQEKIPHRLWEDLCRDGLIKAGVPVPSDACERA